MKKVYDSVNFDYPQCGGKEIFANTKSWSIRQYSNYQGSITHKYWRIPKTLITTIEGILNFVSTDASDEFVTRKGYIVQ